jgi:hypothetical protein
VRGILLNERALTDSSARSYDLAAAEQSLGSQKISDPTDLSFLISTLKGLPEEAQKYLRWAAMFGET